MNFNFCNPKNDRGGVVLVALLVLSFGAVGALVFVQLIATRSLMADSARNALERRVILSNSKALAKNYLYDQVVPAPFSSNRGDVTFTLAEGPDVWAEFSLAGFDPTQYPDGESPLSRTFPLNADGNFDNRVNRFQNRFGYGHNFTSYTIRPDVRIGDGVQLMGFRDEEDLNFLPAENPDDAFRVFEHRMTFFIKARSPLLGGDCVYTLARDNGQLPGTVNGADGSVNIEGRAYHVEPSSLVGSNYTGIGENTVGVVPFNALGPVADAPIISNFPDVVHTWGRAGVAPQVNDYQGHFFERDTLREFQRFRANYADDPDTNYRYIIEELDTYDQLGSADPLAGVPVLKFQRPKFADSLVPGGFSKLGDETYGIGTAISDDPNHSAADDGVRPTGVKILPSGSDMKNSQGPGGAGLAAVSQTLRQEGGRTINTLRINMQRLADPVFVAAGVEELELVCNGTYDGDTVLTEEDKVPVLIVIAQPQALERVRVYGSRSDRLLYLSVLNTSPALPAPPTRLKWWWHGTGDIASTPRPSFKLFAEVHHSIVDFQFANLDADVEIVGGFLHSNNINAGDTSSNQLIIKPVNIDAANLSANRLNRIERMADRVGWVETYITSGAEGDRPQNTY